MVNQNKKQDKQHQIPMVVTDEVIRDFGINRKDVVWKRIGNRKCRVVMIDATESEYKAYMEPIWAEIKRKDRESRCLISGKNGKLIRCPESNKCENYTHASDVCREMNRPASLSFLTDEGIEPTASNSFEDEIINGTLLKELISMLYGINPKYGDIFQLLYDGNTQKEIADKLELKQRTVSDYVRKIRGIVQPLTEDTFKD